MIPPHIQNIHRQVERGIFFAPIYEPFDQHTPQRSKITIAKMVEFVVSRTSFTIVEDHDVLSILHQIDAYVEEVYMLRTDDRVRAYIEKILALRVRIYIVFRRVLNRHPQWKQAYIGKDSIFTIMAALYRPFGVDLGIPSTMLESLLVCPTVRAYPDAFRGLSSLHSDGRLPQDKTQSLRESPTGPYHV